MKYYFAYGLNTNIDQMAYRCPDARLIGPAQLKDHRFVFKGCADILIDNRSSVTGVLWEITEKCEHALDILEGVPDFYRKKTVNVESGGRIISAMVYYMANDDHESPPSRGYYDAVIDGYIANGLDTTQLLRAVKAVIAVKHFNLGY